MISAILVVRNVDKVNTTDLVKHLQLTKRGDVIAVVPIDHVFGKDEIAPGAPWTLVTVTGIPAKLSDLSAYLAPEPLDLAQPHKLLHRHQYGFNIDLWNGLPLTLTQALALKFVKPVVQDPQFL